MGRWFAIDPLAEKYIGFSPFNYVANNPIMFIDPDGRSVDGDIYNSNGKWIGSDGKNDNKVYVLLTSNDTKLTKKEAQIEIGKSELNFSCMSSNLINLTKTDGITHTEFQQFAANVYNEAKDQGYEEQANVASAIINRKETHSLGGTWKKTLDRIMSSKDSHEKKMESKRINPGKDDILEGTTTVKLKDVHSGNYQDYINASNTERNETEKMLSATKATITGLTEPDRVNGSNEWRGRETHNVFGNEGEKTSTFKEY